MPTMNITSWYQVGWSTDLEAGGVLPLHYFGQDLVAFRDHAGTVAVLDAHCMHLGANLAYGGCVTTEGLQCPFHGWVWRADGSNASVPYQDRPSRTRTRSWHVRESQGVLMIWFDPQGRDPLWEPPRTFEDTAVHAAGRTFHPTGTGSQSRYERTNVHPQMLLENVVDPQHFRFVHHTPDAPVVLREDIDDYTWHSKVGFGKRWSDGVDRPDDEINTLHVHWSGTGLSWATASDRERLFVTLISVTPVDETTTDVFGTYWPEQLPDDEQTGRHLAVIEGGKLALPDDLEIWNRQIYRVHPSLTTAEGADWRRLRRWSEKLYAEGEDGPLGPVVRREPVPAG
ncbi:MAG: iron-sulfur cluster-binding protein Rieske family protein [Frankiales bacterium]|nr:iron-sulfur cluster-binding protein Rieske family protein [Frankiales bacterium]